MNKGIPGDTASGGLDRIDTDVYFYNPDCVLVEFALNDAFCGFTSELFGRNIQEMIAGIRKNTQAEVVLVTAVWLDDPKSYDFVEKFFYGKLEEMAEKFGLPVARVHEHWRRQVQSGAVDFQELVQFDGVHPTVVGYRLMAEAVIASPIVSVGAKNVPATPGARKRSLASCVWISRDQGSVFAVRAM